MIVSIVMESVVAMKNTSSVEYFRAVVSIGEHQKKNKILLSTIGQLLVDALPASFSPLTRLLPVLLAIVDLPIQLMVRKCVQFPLASVEASVLFLQKLLGTTGERDWLSSEVLSVIVDFCCRLLREGAHEQKLILKLLKDSVVQKNFSIASKDQSSVLVDTLLPLLVVGNGNGGGMFEELTHLLVQIHSSFSKLLPATLARLTKMSGNEDAMDEYRICACIALLTSSKVEMGIFDGCCENEERKACVDCLRRGFSGGFSWIVAVNNLWILRGEGMA